MRSKVLLLVVLVTSVAFIQSCKSCGPLKIPSIEVAVLRPPTQTDDAIQITGKDFPATTSLTIEGFTNGPPKTLGQVTTDAQGAFQTKVTLSCVGIITPKIINVQVRPTNGGTQASAKTDKEVCF